MDLFWPLVIVRWMQLGSLLILFGASLFALYDGGQPDGTRPYAGWASVALVTGLGWLMLSLADMTDDFASLASTATWYGLFWETGFGKVWASRGSILLALFICAYLPAFSSPNGRAAAICALSAGGLASTAWLGHAAADQGLELYVSLASYNCHVLGAGAWLGGLLPLAQKLQREMELDSLQASLERFSRMGISVVVLIVASGIINAYFRSVSLEGLIATSYGRLLSLKLALFVALLGLATTNRWVFMRRLRQEAEATAARRSLCRSVMLEQILGAGIIWVAVVLGSTSPGA
jgi:putative copper resistance protein D